MIELPQLSGGHTDQYLWPCTKWVMSAERELRAFFGSVAELYGLGEAMLSAQDWLEELAGIDIQHLDADPDWRIVTIAAAIRLADRMNAQKARSRCE